MELKIGVIGTGAIGQDHIERLTYKIKGAKVTAVSDVNVAKAKKIAEAYDATFFETGEALIRSSKVDAVVITSLDSSHEEYVLEAIRNEKFAFCEKPLSVDPEGCLRIVEEETKLGKRLVQVGFMRRFDKGYQELKQMIDSKELGETLLLHCAHRNPEVDESYTTPMAVENSVVHEIDTLRWLLQEDYVSAHVVLPKKTKNAHAKLHDPQIIVLETTSGVHIDIEIFANARFGYDIKCEVVCEEGITSLADPAYSSVRTLGKDYTNVSSDWKKRFVDAYDQEFQVWVDSVINGEISGPNAWDGYVASVTTAACSKARDSGSTTEIKLKECPTLYSSQHVLV